jgi:hypothetical protein
MKAPILLVICICGLLVTSSMCAVFLVPSEYTTIQSAVDSAAQGDTVLVADGVYRGEGNNNIAWDAGSKHIVIKSEGGAPKCTLDIEANGRGFLLNAGQDNSDVIDGFTIINGWVIVPVTSCVAGGAILCDSTSPTIINSVFFHNVAGDTFASLETSFNADGGAIDCVRGSAPRIVNNVFDHNFANHTGGALHFDASGGLVQNNIIKNNMNNGCYGGGGIACVGWAHPIIVNNLICNNSSKYYKVGGFGGGIICLNADPLIISNTIVNNTTLHDTLLGEGGGIRIRGLPSPIIMNCIIWNNVADPGLENLDFQYADWTLSINNCDIQGGLHDIKATFKETVFDSLPAFTNEGSDDFSLTAASPCRNAGTTQDLFGILPMEDLAGLPRESGTSVDIGAYEFQEVSALTPTAARKPEKKIKIQSSPFSDQLLIHMASSPIPASLWIYDCSGRTVAHVMNISQPSVRVNCAKYPSGRYVVKVQSGKEMFIETVLHFN